MKARIPSFLEITLSGFLAGYMALPPALLSAQPAQGEAPRVNLPNASAANSPPALSPVTNRTINVGQNFSVFLRGTDTDLPPQHLSFALAHSPTGAVLSTFRETNTILRWIPGRTAAKTTNAFAVTVTDDGVPNLSATQSFEVVVTDFVQAGFGTLVLQAGEDGCVPIQLDSTQPITNITFFVSWRAGTLTNFAILPHHPSICASNVQMLSATQAVVRLSACPGASLVLTQAVEVADLCFTATAGQESGFVPLRLSETIVQRLDGTSVTNASPDVGRTVVVGDKPMLEAVFTPEQQRRLFLYGRPGAVYQVESTTNLNGAPWELACRIPMTGPSIVVCCADLGTNTIFYRAFRYSDGPTNQIPIVLAGPDQVVHVPRASLQGSAMDDGLPAACQPLTYAWTNLTGPGLVSFSSRTSAVTTATFSQPGTYILRLAASDSQDVGIDDLRVTVLPPPCIAGEAAGWRGIVTPLSGYASGQPGSVVFTNCEAVLTEGDSFIVAAERNFTIPTNAGALYVSYMLPGFDTSTTNHMRDAFEMALVDATGRPLTFTIQGATGITPANGATPQILPASPDAFFNHTEGHAPFVAPGAVLQYDVPSAGIHTLKVDVSQLAPASNAKLIFRLVNNDGDRATSVRIKGLNFSALPPGLTLPGSPGAALSMLRAGSSGSFMTDSASRCAQTPLRFESIGAALAAPAVPQLPIPIGVVAWWSGDGNASDIVGTNHGMSFNGATASAAGVFRQAFTFDGVDDYVAVPNSPKLFPGTNSFTIFAWFRSTNTESSQRIFDKYENTAQGGEFTTTFRLSIVSNHLNGYVRDTDHGRFSVDDGQSLIGITPVADGCFHFGVFQRDVGAGKMRLYLDGRLDAEAPLAEAAAGPLIDDNGVADPFLIGVASTYHSFVLVDFFQGNLDEVALAHRALASNEIVALYAAGIGETCNPNPPPQLFVTAPANQSSVSVRTALLTGYALLTPPAPSNRLTLVTINGTPVDTLDAAGNFFSAVEVKPGRNVFEVVATDSLTQSTTNSVTVYGTTCPQNFSSLGEVSASVEPEYGRTSFNEWTRVLYADLALRNAGSYPIRAPFYVGVTHITDPNVRLLSPDGVSADGVPYYDFSATLQNGALNPASVAGLSPTPSPTLKFAVNGNVLVLSWPASLTNGVVEETSMLDHPRWAWNEVFTITGATNQISVPMVGQAKAFRIRLPQPSSLSRTLAFHNPNHAQFTYDIVVLGQLNQAPAFTTTPVLEAIVGQSYNYDFNVADPDGDVLTYSLPSAPTGLVLNAQLSTLNFQPSTNHLGTHDIRLRAEDGKGGSVEQHFLLNVINAPSNRPPYFVSTPVTQARVATNGGNIGCLQPPPGLIGWWPGDSDAEDLVLGNNGTLQNRARIESGRVGSSFSLDGSSSFVEIPDVPQYSLSNQMSLAAWIFPQRTSGINTIASQYDTSLSQASWAFSYRDDGRLDILLYSGAFASLDGIRTTTPVISVGQWMHVAATVNLSVVPARMRLYINGIEAETEAWIEGEPRLASIFDSASPIRLGTTRNSAGALVGFFLGRIDEMSIFNRALSPGEIADLYAAGSAGMCKAGPQLLRNPGFELTTQPATGQGILPDDWSDFANVSPGADTFSNDGSFGVAPGAFSQFVGVNAAAGIRWVAGAHFSDGGFEGIVQPLNEPLHPGTQYAFRAYLRLTTRPDNGFPGGYDILLAASSDRENMTNAILVARLAEATPATEWQLREVTFTAPTNASFLTNLILRPYSGVTGGTAYIGLDNLFLGEQSPGNQQAGCTNCESGYSYRAVAIDADSDGLTYSLIAAPTNMTINPITGIIRWGPTADQIGIHDVTVLVHDGRGGSNTQTYLVCVLSAEGNRPPMIISKPVTLARDSERYSCEIDAVDPDFDALTYSLRRAPDGMEMNSTSGLITWPLPRTNQSPAQVIVKVADGRGGFDELSFTLDVKLGLGELHGVAVADLNGNGLWDPGRLVPNGDFRLGKMLFSSEYTYTPNLNPPSAYYVGTNPASHHGAASSFGDHTTGDGLMMIVNGSTTGNSVVWEQNITVTPATTYRFSSWGASWVPDSPANLQFVANGNQIGTNFTLPLQTAQWIELFANWDSGTNESVQLQIKNFQGAFGGNDFAIDDIGFGVAERTLSNVVVYLDLNQNGRKDDCDMVTRAGIDGRYSFTNLPAGAYSIRVGRLAGWRLFAPSNGMRFVELHEGQKLDQLDFGFSPATNSDANSNPIFITLPSATPIRAAAVFLYQALAVDTESDSLNFDLITQPEGMLVETNTGVVVWRPLLSQLGTHDVILRVQDGRGGVALQSWQITVVAPNSAPVITSIPPGPAVVNVPYHYVVRAQDAEGQALTFTLTNSPAGVSFNPAYSNAQSAVLTWTPAVADLGSNHVEVIVRDSGGAEARQVFDLDVVISAVNRPPIFTSTARTQTRLGLPYAYLIEATDADGDSLTMQLVSGPTGMVLTNSQPPAFNSRLLVWTPTPGQLGSNAVTLEVSDGRGGTAQQQFSIHVISTLSNQPPRIVSTPLGNGMAGQPYEYNIEALDLDGDIISWTLLSGPVGMSIDPAAGTLRWNPTLDQLGSNTVVVEARDSFLASDTQTFSVAVGCLNRPPQITSIPPTTANVGEPYLYAVRAEDADGDALTFSFVSTNEIPSGMTLSNLASTAHSGLGGALIRWTPATNQSGAHLVRLRVRDGRGGENEQSYNLYAVDERANHAPVIVSSPPRGATTERPYSYLLRATDSDGDLLTLQLLSGPAGAALTPFSSGFGVAEASIQWTPTVAQAGPKEFIVTARDAAGANASQRFTVTVRSNTAPIIVSTPLTNAVPTVAYRYDVHATDLNGDALTYALIDSPAGMSIDSLGRITWTPALAQIGSNAVAVTVSDGFGGQAAQNYVVLVAADTQPPQVGLTVNYNLQDGSGNKYVRAGTQAGLRVTATDNVGVASRALFLDGVPIALANDGSATASFPTAGLVQAIAQANDASGNTASLTNTISVVDPDAASTVAILIHSPTNGAELTKPANVVATISSAVPLRNYILEYAELTPEAGEVEVNLAHPSLVYHAITNATFPPGLLGVTNLVLGRFDPTMLQNGGYAIRVTAFDLNGQGRQEGVIVSVSGNLKFGEFRVAFTDLQIPVAGIPITIQRVYDTRDAQRPGDFGYGWTLGVQNARILEIGKKPFYGFGDEGTTFSTKTRVFLNTPDGRRVGFRFTPEVSGVGLILGAFYRPAFTSDPGVYDKLESIPSDGGYQIEPDGSFTGGFGLVGYDPTGYRLTTKEGTVYEYDQNFGLQKVTDPNGNALAFSRDTIQHTSAGSSLVDQQITFVRDAQGRITQIIDPNGKALRYAYDARGDLRSFTDQVSNVTQYAYSAARAHYLTNIIDPLGRSALRLEYDSAGRLTTVRDAGGNPVSKDFNPDLQIGTFTDGNGNVTRLRFDDRGNETERALTGVSTNHFSYDANDNLLASTNGRGFSTNYSYDARGNVTSITDSLGHRTTIAYNEQSKPVGVTNALGQVLNLRYDPAGKLVEVINNAGLSTAVARDAQGRVAALTDAGGHTTTFDYAGGCSCGRPGKVINPDGSFRLYEYDLFGQTTRLANELGAETLSSYDDYGRLQWTRDPLTNYTQFYYNGLLLTNIVDALGRSTRYQYDAQNRTNAIIDAQGGVVRFEYDQNGNRTRVIDPVTNVTTFVYDTGNRLVQQIDPLGHTNFFAYDAAGNRTEAFDRNGRKRTFRYDAANRMTNELWWEGTNVVRSIVFGFNEVGVQTLAADPAARYEYSYDALNRLERVLSQSAGVPDFTLLYTYTALGQVASVTDHWGVRVGSGYDNRNRLASRTWSSTLPGAGVDPARVDFAYDASGNRLRTDRFADLAGTNRIGFTTNAYNHAGLVTNITHLGPASEVLAKYDYQLDAAYQITRWAIGNQLSDFAYDRTGQLTNALNTAQPDENFRFDANGNRVGAQSGASYVVGGNNQILSDGTNRYAYDAEGSMISRSNTMTGVLTIYQWDHRNRLVSVLDRNPGGAVTQTVAFVYDAMNRRLSKTVNGQVQRFLYNQDDSWADLDGTNAVTARYLHGARIDELLARQRAGDGRGWYLTDHLGTVRDIANAAGAAVAHVDYSSFGQVLGASNAGAVDRFLFTGRELDGETGLYFYRARYYAQTIGRFLSNDSMAFDAGDMNFYRYVRNTPFTYRDPSGNVSIVEYAIDVAKVAAIAGAAASTSCEVYLFVTSKNPRTLLESTEKILLDTVKVTGISVGVAIALRFYAITYLPFAAGINQFSTAGRGDIQVAVVTSVLVSLVDCK